MTAPQRPKPVDRVESEADKAQALAELGPIFDVVHRWQMDGAGDVVDVQPGSSLAGDDRATAPYQLSHVAEHAIGVAVGHLHCLRAAVQEAESLHAWAPYTLLRAAIESAAAALYLLGPASRDERVTCRLRLEWANQLDRDRMARCFGAPVEPSLAQNREHLRGIVARRRSLRDAVIFGSPPGYAAVVRGGGTASSLGGPLTEGLWRRCSGMTHGRSWALLSVLDREQVSRAAEGVLHVRLTSSATDVAMTTKAAAVLTAEASALLARRARRH